MNETDLINMIPRKMVTGVLEPKNARLRDLEIMLKKYKFTEMELNMLKTEIENNINGAKE